MLEYVPVRFDLYRPLRPCLRWTLQCLVSFVGRDPDGKCWPSVRTLARFADCGKSTVARHLAELAKLKVITRKRRVGGVYTYTIDRRFLPAAAKVSHSRVHAVPPARAKENLIKKKEDSHIDSIAAEPPLTPAERAERVQRLDAVLAGIMAGQKSGRRAAGASRIEA